MKEIKSPLEKIKPQLNSIKKRLEWAKDNNNNLSYKLEFCMQSDNDWQFAHNGSDSDMLVKTVKEIISQIGADAIRVSFYLNNRLKGAEIMKLTDVVIPLFEKPETNTEKNNQLSGYDSKANDFFLQGFKTENDNQLKIMQIQHDNAVQRLNDKIELLKEKVELKDNYIEQLEREYEQYESVIKNLQEQVSAKKVNSDNRQNILLAAGLGKVLNMKTNEIFGLAGLLTGNDNTSKSNESKEELLNPENEAQSQNTDNKRKEDIKIISDWLINLDTNTYEYVCSILKTLAEKPELFYDTMKYVDEIAKEKKEIKKEENPTEENPTTTTEQQNIE